MREQPAMLLLLPAAVSRTWSRVSESVTKLRFSRADNVDKPEFILLEALSENVRKLLVIMYCVGTQPAFPDRSKIAALE